MNDKRILSALLKKYGKEQILNVINEAFASDKLRTYDTDIRNHNRKVNAAASADRLSKMERLYKRHFDTKNFDGDTKGLGWQDRVDDPEDNRRRYMNNANEIQYNFERYILDHKFASFSDMVRYYGLNDIPWSDVKDADFREMDKVEAKKLARNPRWGQFIIFWERHNGTIYAISRGSTVVYCNSSRAGHFNDIKVKDLVDNDNVARAFVLDISKTAYKRNDKKADRRAARDGMIDRNKETNDRIRQENIARYKRIIAQNNVNRFDMVDKNVRIAVKNSAKFFADSDDMKLVFKLNKLVEALLVEYESFCNVRDELKRLNSIDDKSFYGGRGDQYNTKLKGKVNQIDDIIERINNLLA